MFEVPIRCSRHALFFNLILFAQLANCGFWRRTVDSVMEPSEQADPGEVLPFVGLPPSNPTFFANQSIQPSSSSSSSLPCEATCVLQASSVALYYWPQESTNTACLATVPNPPLPTIPPGLNPVSPSAYVFFISLTISQMCGPVLASYATSTASLAPDQLSTIDKNGQAQPFNLADLPCPPASVKIEPGEQFNPLFAWEGQFYNYGDPSIADQCSVVGGLNGILDPPGAFPTALGGLGGTGQAGNIHGRFKREPANAPVTPWMPARTTTAI